MAIAIYGLTTVYLVVSSLKNITCPFGSFPQTCRVIFFNKKKHVFNQTASPREAPVAEE